MRRGGLDAATQARAHFEGGLHAVVDEVRGRGTAELVGGIVQRAQRAGTRAADILDGGQAAVVLQDLRVGAEALSHRWPGREDDQVGVLQARRHLVEIVEAGGQAGDRALVLVALLQ